MVCVWVGQVVLQLGIQVIETYFQIRNLGDPQMPGLTNAWFLRGVWVPRALYKPSWVHLGLLVS